MAWRFTGLLAFYCFHLLAQTPGAPLPPWQKGMLDLHHINTGMGDAAFCIFPDGTTLLVDAGEMPPNDPRAGTPRNAKMHPNNSKTAPQWITHYIKRFMPGNRDPKLDYAMITHFHSDHWGKIYPGVKKIHKRVLPIDWYYCGRGSNTYRFIIGSWLSGL